MKIVPLFVTRDEPDSKFRLSMDGDGEVSREATPKDETLEALAQMLDEEAENCNAHDFVACHRGLAAIMFQELGRASATKVMRRLVNYEGLYGLTGVCGKGDVDRAEKELGMSLHDWSDWKLTK